VAIALRSAGLALVFLAFVALTFAGCDQTAQTAGTVTGQASPCVGPPAPGENLNRLRYTISLKQGRRTIAHQTLTGDTASTYRFQVPAGHCRVKNFPGSESVIVRARQTTHTNLFESCG
jgi:hypothetical protein